MSKQRIVPSIMPSGSVNKPTVNPSFNLRRVSRAMLYKFSKHLNCSLNLILIITILTHSFWPPVALASTGEITPVSGGDKAAAHEAGTALINPNEVFPPRKAGVRAPEAQIRLDLPVSLRHNLAQAVTAAAIKEDVSPDKNLNLIPAQNGSTTFLGPTAYLSQANSPFVTFIGSANFYLENFEDSSLNTPDVSASGTNLQVIQPGTLADSVDGDDGNINGSGQQGRSYWAFANPGITFTFNQTTLGALPTRVGIVWTDGGALGFPTTVTFEAFDANGVSLGTITGNSADGNNNGGTAEDRFYGVIHLAGVSKILIKDSGGGGIEVDHLQYGAPSFALPPDSTHGPKECPICSNEERSNFAGGGINTFTGNYHYQTADLSVATVGRPLIFERSYNSLTTLTDTVVYSQSLGHGWTHNYDLDLTFATDPYGEADTIILKAPHGSRMRFTDNGNGTYTAFPGVWATLTRTVVASSTVYTITAANQESFVFNGSGKLTQQIDPQGNLLNFSRTNGITLTRVTDEESARYLDFGYDGQGRLLAVTDHTSRSVSYGYDLNNNLTVITDTRGLTWTYAYTGAHLLGQVIDPDGRTVEKTFFDSEGRTTHQEDGSGNPLVQISYITSGTNEIRAVNEAGKVYTDTYDARNLLVNQTNALAQAQDYDFDAAFNRNFSEDGNGHQTHYARTDMGRTLAITDALTQVTRFTYDDNNNLETSKDARGFVTTYEYDSDNTLRQVINPPEVGGTTVYTYNSRGQVTEMQDERGHKSFYSYDPATGDRTEGTDAEENTTTYEYDQLGRVITTTEPSTGSGTGKITVNQYDGADHLVKVTENYTTNLSAPANEYNLITRYEYDGAGRQTIITDTLNRMTLNVYDGAGRLERTIQNPHPSVSTQNYANAYNLITRYEYDGFGRQTAITDTLGQATRTIYDEQTGRVHRTIANYENGTYTSLQPDEDIVTEYGYDANGNVVKMIEFPDNMAEKRITCTVYDALNRVKRTVENCVTNDPDEPGSYSSEADEDLASLSVYDAVGNQIEVYDPLNRKTTYQYDALNRVITMTNPLLGQTIYRYDPAGNRTSMTDAEDHTTTYQYDRLNRVVTTTNHLQGQTGVVYDAVGNRIRMIDANTHALTYTYDSLYRLTQITDAKNQATVFTYDALGNKLTQEDAEEVITRYQYDSLGRLITTTQNYVNGGPNDFETNVTTSVAYDPLGRQTAVTDGRGYPTHYGYDALGRTTAITDALSHATYYTYDGRGNRTHIVNPKSEIVNFQYDGVDRLIEVEDLLEHLTTYQYNKAGERVATIDAEQVETRYGYDALGRLTHVTENYDNGIYTDENIPDKDVTTGYGYDRVGNRIVITNTLGYTTTYRYDALNRRDRTIDAPGHVTAYEYDKVGNQTVITDANLEVTIFTYDPINQLTHINYSDSTPDVAFTYDNVGNRETMADAETGQTVYEYDKLYRLAEVTQPISGSQTFVIGYGHDEVGNRTRLTYPNNQGEVSYIYDAANRLITATNWLGGQFGYNYDEANRLTGLSLPNGVDSLYDYDDAGRLSLLAHSTLTDTVASYVYELDEMGNRRVLTETLVTAQSLGGGAYLEETGQVVLEAENGQLTPGFIHQWLTATTQSGYTGTAYLQAVPDIDQLYQTSAITASPMVTYSIHFSTAQTYTLWLRGYPANAAGDSVYVSLGDSNVEVTGFAPEAWSWARTDLTGATATLPVETTGLQTVTLRMREDGLRIDRLLLTTDTNYVPTDFGPAETPRLGSQTILTAPLTRTIVYTYDNLYRLTNADYTTGETYAYEYDPVGNRLEQIINGDTTEYQYDAANRLSQVDGQSYTFDDNGNLLNTGVMTNTFDAANRLAETQQDGIILEPIYNGIGDRVGQTNGTTTTHFALDIEGLPEVIYTSEGDAYLHLPGVIMAESNTGEIRYLLSDGLGSIRQAVDENGEVIAYNEFDPYGNPVENGSEPYGFTGEWWEEVGLLHLRARWYMPYLNQFISPDPIIPDYFKPQSLNRYSYAFNNPVNFIDPSGLYPPGDPAYQTIDPVNEDAYIIGVIQDRKEEIKAAAHRHNLRPDFLAAVLYLENNNPSEQWLQGIIGDFPQQCAKYLWNALVPFTEDPKVYAKDINLLGIKQYDYFKPGRSQGIGAIKPEVAVYLQQLGLIYDPQTGEQMNFPNIMEMSTPIVTINLGNFPEEHGLYGLNGESVFGTREHPSERINMLLRLADQSWSIEYLAAHLDAARYPKNTLEESWPPNVSKSDNSSEAVLRLMVTYHHNVDNLVGWNDPTNEVYQTATKIIEWMPTIAKLIAP